MKKEVVKVRDKENEKLLNVHDLGQKAGRAQAFRAIKILSEYLEWKSLVEIVDNKETLNNLGFKTIDDYLNHIGLQRSSAYNQLKIARTLTPEDVQLFGQIGLTRRTLLEYAKLPEDQRLQLKNGKVLNLETADKTEIKSLIEELIMDNKEIREMSTKTIGHLQNASLSFQDEIKSLRSKIPNEHSMDWAWGALERISHNISEIQSNLNFLLDSKDHRLVANPELKARVNGLFTTAKRMLIEVFDKIDELTGYHPDRKEGENE